MQGKNAGMQAKEQVADGVRFELTEGVNPRRFSRPLHSTALPSIR